MRAAAAPQGPWIPRQALHAWALTLHHPALGRDCTFRAPPPEDMCQAAAMLGLPPLEEAAAAAAAVGEGASGVSVLSGAKQLDVG